MEAIFVNLLDARDAARAARRGPDDAERRKFDRNQGNIQRARLEVSKMQVSVTHLQREVEDEVRASAGEFDRSLQDQRTFEAELIPEARLEFDEAIRADRSGRLDGPGFRAAQRDLDQIFRAYREVVVRHRRSLGRLNAAVGQRVVPCLEAGMTVAGGEVFVGTANHSTSTAFSPQSPCARVVPR